MVKLPMPVFLISLSLGGIATPAKASWLKISLSTQAEVDGPRVYLGDISSCEALAIAQCRHLATIDLGPAAEAGTSLSISRDDIAAALATEYPGRDLSLQGSPVARVKTRSKLPDIGVIKNYVEEFITTNFEDKNYKIEVEQISLSNPSHGLPVASGRYQSSVLDSSSGLGVDWFLEKVLKPKQIAMEYVEDANEKVHKFTVRIHAKLMRKVPVAARNIHRGARINSTDITSAWLDLEKIQRSVVESRDILGRDLKSSIRVGQAFGIEHLSEPNAVKRGQKIKVRFEQGTLTITGDAKVLQDAKLNQSVNLEMLNTKKKISATLVSPDLAVVRSL